MNVRHPMGVLHSFSIKNIFYDKMDLMLFYFDVVIWRTTFQKAVENWRRGEEVSKCLKVLLPSKKRSNLQYIYFQYSPPNIK